VRSQQEMTVAKRILKVIKWLGMTPAVGACVACTQEFKVPLDILKRTRDAQENLQAQFDRHVCRTMPSND
jgi:hypothetical protein